jgi:hypothetical protein
MPCPTTTYPGLCGHPVATLPTADTAERDARRRDHYGRQWCADCKAIVSGEFRALLLRHHIIEEKI